MFCVFRQKGHLMRGVLTRTHCGISSRLQRLGDSDNRAMVTMVWSSVVIAVIHLMMSMVKSTRPRCLVEGLQQKPADPFGISLVLLLFFCYTTEMRAASNPQLWCVEATSRQRRSKKTQPMNDDVLLRLRTGAAAIKLASCSWSMLESMAFPHRRTG